MWLLMVQASQKGFCKPKEGLFIAVLQKKLKKYKHLMADWQASWLNYYKVDLWPEKIGVTP